MEKVLDGQHTTMKKKKIHGSIQVPAALAVVVKKGNVAMYKLILFVVVR